MNGNNNNNSNQIPKNLPLKKRRAYLVDTSENTQDENSINQRATTNNKSPLFQADPLQIHVPTPPASPHHLELLRQQYAYFLSNNQNLFPLPANFDYSMAQTLLAQQFLDNYRPLIEQQYQNSQRAYTVIENSQDGTDATIDEHFRKSLREHYGKTTGGFLTPEESSSNNSPTERTPADSIEEHFARSLGKFWPLSTSTAQSDVDDHFAKALGATAWEQLKEKS